MIPPLERQQPTGEKVSVNDFALLQDRLREFVQILEDNPILDGHVLENVTIYDGQTTIIDHRLGRQIRGWIVTDLVLPSGVNCHQIKRMRWDENHLDLYCDSSAITGTAITINLYVF